MTPFIQDFFWSQLGSFFAFFGMLSYWILLAWKKKKNWWEKRFSFFSKFCIWASQILFGVTLLLRWINQHYFPLSNLYESLIFLSWCLASLLLFFEGKMKSQLLGVILAPLLFFLSSFSTLSLPLDMQKAVPLVPSLQSNWLMMHVSMMMLSYATLLTGSTLSIFYLCLSKFRSFQISKKESKTNFSNLSSFSLLETVENWSARILSFGFPLLTLGILSGAIWANEAWGSYWSWDPKETWALITWLIFASYLHAKFVKSWEGEKAAWISFLGFLSLWICYLGVNFLGKGLHSYGWILT